MLLIGNFRHKSISPRSHGENPFFLRDSGSLWLIRFQQTQLSQFLQNRVRHLHGRRSALADRLSAPPGNRIISYVRTLPSRTTSAIALRMRSAFWSLIDVIEHHRRRQNHRNRIHDRRIQFGILGRRTVRGLEDGNVVANVARRREAQARRPVRRMRRKECRRTNSTRRSRCTLPDSCSATSVARRCSSTRARCPDNSSPLPWRLLPSCRKFRAPRSASRRWSRL